MHAARRAGLRVILRSAYHGILAPCASWRDQVVPAGDAAIQVPGCEPEAKTEGPIEHPPNAECRAAPTRTRDNASEVGSSSGLNAPYRPAAGGVALAVDPRGADSKPATRHRVAWAELLQRVFGVDALRCPRCGSTMRILAAIEDPDIARKILECLDLPARAPPLDPAPNPSTWDESDSRGTARAWDFDQTPPDEDGPP